MTPWVSFSLLALAVAQAAPTSPPGTGPDVAPASDALPLNAPGAPAHDTATYVDLVTIGPGDELWTSFGHTALHVIRVDRTTGTHQSTVYNWGDADFGGWDFMWSFFVGKARFRLTEIGSLQEVVNIYAPLNRTLVQQRFALDPRQVDALVKKLEYFARPENREYVYHHMTATCATKVRDLLDEDILGGAIRAQLGNIPETMSPREYGRKYFAGFFFAELFNDLFLGRLHDRPWSHYEAMAMPQSLAAYLQEVQVPDPSGGTVPLLGEGKPIVTDVPAPPYRGEGRSLIHLTYLWIALVVAMGVYMLRRRPVVLEDAGFWLFIWALPAVAAEWCAVFGASVSAVAEGRINELLIAFPPTDVVLLPVAFLWWRGKAYLPRWLRLYSYARLGLVIAVLLGHATGILYQEPRVLLVLATLCTSLLVVIVRRFPQAQAAASSPPMRQEETSASAA